MNFQFIKPSGILSQYIRHYWILEASAFEGEVCERIVPTGNIELFFHYGNPFKVKQSNYCVSKQPRSFISGISSGYADVSTQGESGVFVVFCWRKLVFVPLIISHFSFPTNYPKR